MNDTSPKPGRLYLVSVGIGDPDNLTLRAQRTIKSADVVFCMRFVRERFEELLHGKIIHDAGHLWFTRLVPTHALPYDEEGERQTRVILRSAIEAGNTVAVLDYGDPTLYSPQSGYLSEFADLRPVVIPGISSINAANAALRREISGNYDHPLIISDALGTDEATAQRIERLARIDATLVFLTMGADLPFVIDCLRASLPDETPAILVLNAGHAETERVVESTLKHLLERFHPADLPWQYLLYVGRSLRRNDLSSYATVSATPEQLSIPVSHHSVIS